MGRPSVITAGVLLLCIAVPAVRVASGKNDTVSVDIKVPPDFEVQGNDSYVCVVVALPPQAHRLVGVVPAADEAVVHHILLYGAGRVEGSLKSYAAQLRRGGKAGG
jgi:hypothetical protein